MDKNTLEHTEKNHKVTPLELFFDLVFVFAITQVTGFLYHHLNPEGIAEGLLILALIWWAWVAYAWLGTTIRFDEGLVRILLLLAMGAVLVVSLGIPEAFEDLPGGFDHPLGTPTVIAMAYSAVRLLHLGLYALAGRGSPHLLGAILRFGIPVIIGLSFFIAGTYQSGPARLVFYAIAVCIDFGGALIGGGKGWIVQASHFAERHGLIIIIALGESVFAVGSGATGVALSWQTATAAVLGLGISACLWWIYFDVTSLAAENKLLSLQGTTLSRAARDAYSYLHFPMVAGIVLLALGFKSALSTISDQPFLFTAPIHEGSAALWAGGIVYLMGHVGFRLRMTGTWGFPRLFVAMGLLLALSFSGRLPALVELGTLFLALALLVIYETLTMGSIGGKLRHKQD